MVVGILFHILTVFGTKEYFQELLNIFRAKVK